MKLTEQHIFYKNSKKFNSLDNLCFLSKNLYNACLHRIKNEFSTSGKWIRYNDLEKEFKLSNNFDYRNLPNNSSQQIMIILDNNFKSYFKGLKSFKKSKTSFTGCPVFPHFKHKTKGRNIVIFTSNQFKLRGNEIYFPKKSGLLPIKTKIDLNSKIHQVRIVPRNESYVIEIIYTYNEKINSNKNNDWLSIDLGVNNLAACVTTNGNPFIVNGKPLKSINQYYNKKKAFYQSKLGFYINKKGEKQQYSKSKRIIKLTNKRNNKINDYMHKSSRLIINYCKENQIDNLVVGRNTGWKHEVSMSKKNNQNFVQIPFNKFESYLYYKGLKEGFNVILREESYTSKASALDLDLIPTYGDNITTNFSGKRIKRGLYKTSKGILINSDINGSVNILRKEIGDEWFNSILLNRGLVVSPIMVIPL